ncbi:MAG: O-antigen ligase family protein, partial [Candidatus Omnitrophica bacterium]|nr:O-antigen ligase family protein [Candidatus Omnitrophota bacterium]
MSFQRFFVSLLNFLQSALVFFIVLLPAPWIGGLDTTAFFTIRVLILAAFFLFLLRNPSFHSFPSLFFLAFVGLAFLQAVGGPALVFTKFLPGSVQPFETQEHALQLLFYFLFFLVCLNFFSSRKNLRLIVFLLAVEIVFLIALGYYQERSGVDRFRRIYGFYDVENYMSFFSSFLNSNHYGGFLAAASPLFLGSLFYRAKEEGSGLFRKAVFIEWIFFLVLLPAMGASLLFAGARAAFAVFILLCLLFAGRALSWEQLYKRWWIMGGLGACFVFFLMFAGLAAGDVLKEFTVKLLSAFGYRLSILRESLGVFLDFPLFGTGLGTYRWISKAYQMTDAENFRLTHVHNDALELLTDTGVVGFILFLLPVTWVVFAALRGALRSSSLWNRVFGLSSFAGIAALAFLSLTEFYVRTPAIGILLVVHLAVLVNCGGEKERERLGGEGSRVKAEGSKFFPGWFVACLALMVFMGHAAYRHYLSQRILDRAERHKEVQHAGRDFEALRRAVSLTPGNPKGWAVLGDAYYDSAFKGEASGSFIEKSIEAYQAALARAPTWAEGWFYLGKSKMLAGRPKEG